MGPDLTLADVGKYLVFWGPGAAIAGTIIFSLYKLTAKFGWQFIKSQQDSAIALGLQAQSMIGLTKSLESYMTRDNSEHREMLVLLKYIAQSHQSLEEVKREHYDRIKGHIKCEVEGEIGQH